MEEEAVYSIPSVNVSEPDENGYVTYIIDYNTNGTYDIEFAFDVADHTDGWSSNPQQYNVIDYYTGTILCNWEDSYNDDEAEVVEGDIFTDDLNDCRFSRASDLIIEG